jgi:hypothetical protein
LGSVLNRDDGVVYNTDINMAFTFTAGNDTFTGNGSGDVQGKLVLMPEPVSSILFLSGGGILALRRYYRKKNKLVS